MEKIEQTHILDLLFRMRQGDQAAFSEIYDAFAERIYKYILLKVSDSGQAEDLLQEVFVKVWQGRGSLRLERRVNFSAWVYKIASNSVNDFYRKIYRRPQTVPLEPGFDLPGSADSEKSTQQFFDAKEVGEALAKLPADYKQIIELRFFQEFTIEETAEILGKSNIAVRVLQHRALKKLEKVYKIYGQ